MDAGRFDQVTRAFVTAPSRRNLLGLTLGAVGGLNLGDSEAKKRRKRENKKKVKFNDLGCVNVGKFCKNASQCCSGICQGKKDKKKCKAHDTADCPAGESVVLCTGGSEVSCSPPTDGKCATTTGNAAYCAHEVLCFPCTKDVECQEVCGPQAACVQCAVCLNTAGAACASPAIGLCQFPCIETGQPCGSTVASCCDPNANCDDGVCRICISSGQECEPDGTIPCCGDAICTEVSSDGTHECLV